MLERCNDLRDCGLLLTNRVVDADDPRVVLVQDRVDRHGGLPGLPVADDQLALSPADRDHCVDGFQPRLQRLPHRLPIDDAGRQTFNRRTRKRADRSFAVERLPEGVHHTSQERVSDRHGQDASSPPHGIAFLDVLALPQ